WQLTSRLVHNENATICPNMAKTIDNKPSEGLLF
ncbi:unnamed protein product, partial [marine sediment metagenome]